MDPIAPAKRTVKVAEELLIAYRETVRSRDQIVTLAYEAGLTKYQIYIHSGIARSTIDRILERGTDAG